jgi:predicted  nucleic acid-binding Zn-ribbon protein
MEPNQLGVRVAVLEREMQWAKDNTEILRSNLLELKTGQNRLADHMMDIQARMDSQFVEVYREFANVHNEFSQMHGGFTRIHGEFSNVRAEFIRVHGEVSNVHADLHNKISGVDREIAEVHGKISNVHADLHGKISGVHGEIAEVHGKISNLHESIARQTRWILTAILGAATLVSLGLPIALQLVKRYL